jgi:hypothetical protein
VKKLATLLITVLALAITPVANADSIAYEVVSGDDRSQPAGMNYRFSPNNVSMQIFESNRSEIIIKVFFVQAINPNSLMDYTSLLQNNVPVLRVKFMNQLDTYKGQGESGNLWLEAPRSAPYQGSTKLNATASVYANPAKGADGGRTYLTGCTSKTWMADGATSQWVAFSIDRSCAGLADRFWLNVYFDSNINSLASTADYKYLPADPIYVNLENVPKAPVIKNQTVAFVGSIGTQNLDNPTVTTTVTSSLSMPLSINSLTPTICLPGAPTPSPTLSVLSITTKLLKAGTCTLEAFALGDAATNPSPRVTQSFTVNPKVIIKQELSWNEPVGVKEGDSPFDLYLSSSAGLPVKVTSNSPSVCQFFDPLRPSWVSILGSGTCSISVRVDGTDKYFEATGSASFYVEPKPVVKPTTAPKTPTPSASKPPAQKKPIIVLGGTGTTTTSETFETKQGTADTRGVGTKKTTITCKKGALEKKVTDVKPVCPKGWTKK